MQFSKSCIPVPNHHVGPRCAGGGGEEGGGGSHPVTARQPAGGPPSPTGDFSYWLPSARLALIEAALTGGWVGRGAGGGRLRQAT